MESYRNAIRLGVLLFPELECDEDKDKLSGVASVDEGCKSGERTELIDITSVKDDMDSLSFRAERSSSTMTDSSAGT